MFVYDKYMGIHMSQNACGGQEIILCSQFSPTFTIAWVIWTKLKLPGFSGDSQPIESSHLSIRVLL